MTTHNIETMDRIVNGLAENRKLSQVLAHIYAKRNVEIPFSDSMLKIQIADMNMSARTTNAIRRARIHTLQDAVEFNESKKITSVKNLGRSGCIEFFEAILDYFWDNMDKNERVSFLIDVVERNSHNLR